MNRSVACQLLGALAALALALPAATALAQGQPSPGLSHEQEEDLAQVHDGYYGALAPQNLAKPRPQPPFNLTGTWFVNLRGSFADFMFGPPYPHFYKAGQEAMRLAAAAKKAHQPFRDASGECWPIGMPMILTRVWPINIIQLPTAVFMIDGFFDSLRTIYTDGRKHTPYDVSVDTYNGESIGHWTKDALIIDTLYFASSHHYIDMDMGIPISSKLHIIERITLLDQGHTLQDEFTMTDPDMWQGEWKSTKRFIREDYSDIPENECLPDTDLHLPGTATGHAEAQKESHIKAPAPKP
ncbi:MAG TPA: hypothetical protein VMF64_06940 [Steroidobacteraceae bacterium]|nr:hypothetical protein [Steroidobacteraceae bacterium]